MIWHNSAPLWTDRVQIKYQVTFNPMHAHTKFGANQRFRSVVILVTRCSAACSAPSGQIVSVSNIKVSFPTLHAGPKFDANQRFRSVVILMTCCSASGIVAPPVVQIKYQCTLSHFAYAYQVWCESEVLVSSYLGDAL